MLERVVFMLKRTIYCGALRESAIGKEETVCGWVQTKRDMGGVVFIDLRDREGILQVVFDARELSAEEFTCLLYTSRFTASRRATAIWHCGST